GAGLPGSWPVPSGIASGCGGVEIGVIVASCAETGGASTPAAIMARKAMQPRVPQIPVGMRRPSYSAAGAASSALGFAAAFTFGLAFAFDAFGAAGTISNAGALSLMRT